MRACLTHSASEQRLCQPQPAWHSGAASRGQSGMEAGEGQLLGLPGARAGLHPVSEGSKTAQAAFIFRRKSS